MARHETNEAALRGFQAGLGIISILAFAITIIITLAGSLPDPDGTTALPALGTMGLTLLSIFFGFNAWAHFWSLAADG